MYTFALHVKTERKLTVINNMTTELVPIATQIAIAAEIFQNANGSN